MDDWPEVYRAYVTGFDKHVFPTRVEIEGNVMTCRRPHSDSGKLHVAFPVEGYGRPVLSTSSLPERDAPYLLPLELARGKIGELRDQSAVWELARMSIPDEFREVGASGLQAVLSGDDAARPIRSVRIEIWLAQSLQEACMQPTSCCKRTPVNGWSFRNMLRPLRRRRWAVHSLSCPDDPAKRQLFRSTFQAMAVPISWKQIEPEEGKYQLGTALDELIEYASNERMIIRGGPLVDFSSGGLPDWLAPWEHDVLNMQSFICDFVETAISRYQGRIRLWEVSAYGNSGGALRSVKRIVCNWSRRTLEAAKRNDDDAQLFIRVDQPWGDYQARGQHRLSPFQFVDAIVRSNLGLAGVNLEINVGYRPQGCCSRDMLGFSRLIDHWSMLGIQLHVTLAFPSSDQPDDAADSDLEVAGSVWREPCSEEAQAKWIATYLPLLIAKPAVTGVYWSHWSDGQRHRLPHAGLLRADGTPKPALEILRQLRNG